MIIKKCYANLLMIIFYLHSFCSCNIWDNLYSNLKSPMSEIPEEFKLSLYNGNIKSNKTLFSDIWISSIQNKIKISLYDSAKLTYNLDEMFNLITNNTRGEPLNNIFLNLVIDLNKNNSQVYINNGIICNNIETKFLNNLQLKLFMKSYNFITFLDTTYNSEFYDYAINQFPIKVKLNKEIQNNKTLKYLLDLIGLSQNDNKNLRRKENSIIFRINKNNSKLEEININYDNSELYYFKTELQTFKELSKEIFQIVNCKNFTSISLTDETSLIKLVYAYIFNKN